MRRRFFRVVLIDMFFWSVLSNAILLSWLGLNYACFYVRTCRHGSPRLSHSTFSEEADAQRWYEMGGM
jgi:hypothetical protein